MNVSGNEVSPQISTTTSVLVDRPDFQEYQAEHVLGLILSPCILVVGSLGNIASICVMRRIKDSNSSQYAIFTGLAVSDLVLVVIGMCYRIARFYYGIDIRALNLPMCKAFCWVYNVCQALSAWFLTCVTVQRAMSITWPHKMRALCTLRRTWMVIASLALTACLTYFHILVAWQIDSNNECGNAITAYRETWDWIDMFIDSLIPSFCQMVCGVILCSSLFKAASTMSVVVQRSAKCDQNHDRKRRINTASRITVMCLALSATFLILTLPVDLDEMWYKITNVHLTPKAMAERYLRYSIFNFMVYINSTVNFFLYCITGTKFRKVFVDWICCRGRRPSSASVSDVNSREK